MEWTILRHDNVRVIENRLGQIMLSADGQHIMSKTDAGVERSSTENTTYNKFDAKYYFSTLCVFVII
jgi:hypothetical protein